MDKRIRLNILYDYYKGLFTEKQQAYFEDYYYSNYSLGEIADNENVSRNAVHNQLKIVEERLEELENILGLVAKKEQVISILDGKIDDSILEKIRDIL